jgi:3D (Asp-Asp-Asp) domain-containing protein
MRRAVLGASALGLIMPMTPSVSVKVAPSSVAPLPPAPVGPVGTAPDLPAAGERPESTTTTTTTSEAPVTTSTAEKSALVESTAYCLTGFMADGHRTRRGAVAANRWPIGTRLQVDRSPGVGSIVTVEDRIGYGSDLDFALPGDCASATLWGRRAVEVEVVG